MDGVFAWLAGWLAGQETTTTEGDDDEEIGEYGNPGIFIQNFSRKRIQWNNE